MENLYKIENNNSIIYTDRIALPMFVIRKMIFAVNPFYRFEAIDNSLKKLIVDDETAQFYGYADYQKFKSTLGKVNKNKRKRRDKKRNHKKTF